MLKIEIPILRVGSGEVPRRNENITGRGARRSRERKYRPRRASIESVRVELEWINRRRADWILRQAGRSREVGDQQVLRNVIVVDAVSAANDGLGPRIPGKTNSRTEVVQVPRVSAVHTIRAQHR